MVPLPPILSLPQLIKSCCLDTVWAFWPSSFGKKVFNSCIRIAAGPGYESPRRRVIILGRCVRDHLDLECNWHTYLAVTRQLHRAGRNKCGYPDCLVSHLFYISRVTFLGKKGWGSKKIFSWHSEENCENNENTSHLFSACWRLLSSLPKHPSFFPPFSLPFFPTSSFLLFSFLILRNESLLFLFLRALDILRCALGNHRQTWEIGRTKEDHQETIKGMGLKSHESMEVEERMRVKKVKKKRLKEKHSI